MSAAAGVDARQPEALWSVHVEDGSLARIDRHEDLEALFGALEDVDAIAVNVPIGHEDPSGERGDGRRACEKAAAELLGEATAAERILPMPPFAAYEEEHYHDAVSRCEAEGWPRLPEPIWHGRHRVQALRQQAADDERLVEIHPEVSFTVMNELAGGQGPLETYGRGWSALYERLELLQEAGLRPARSLGGVGRASPRDVIDASAAAWSGHRVAVGEARTLPEDPPTDPSTGRPIAFHA